MSDTIHKIGDEIKVYPKPDDYYVIFQHSKRKYGISIPEEVYVCLKKLPVTERLNLLYWLAVCCSEVVRTQLTGLEDWE